jgi:hypothetical protein
MGAEVLFGICLDRLGSNSIYFAYKSSISTQKESRTSSFKDKKPPSLNNNEDKKLLLL